MLYFLLGAVTVIGFSVLYAIFNTPTNTSDHMVEDEQLHTLEVQKKKCCGGKCHAATEEPFDTNVWNAAIVSESEANEEADFSSLQIDTSSNDCCSNSDCCDSSDS